MAQGIDLKRLSTPGNPSSTHDRLYNDANGTLYFRDSNGVQNQVSPSGAGGANTALSNLAAVAINTSLISDTDSTDDLGSTAKYWLNTYTDYLYLSEGSAPSTPPSGKYALYPKTDGTLYGLNDGGVEVAFGGGAMTSFVMSDGSNNQTIVNGNTQTFASGVAINGTVSATDTVTHNWDLTKLASAVGTLTSSDYLGIYDLSGVAHQRIALADLPTITSLDNTNDKFPIVDATDNRLKLVAPSNLPVLYSSVAILRDEKANATAGGASSATTWNNRDLNTEVYDPDSIVSISSNQFTPIAGDYELTVVASTYKSDKSRLRLYNVTGAASVEEGISLITAAADAVSSTATLFVSFTANGTDAYRIDHYTSAAQATNGLGFASSAGVNEVYLEMVLRKLV
jgi:hypothetical protein